jgi:hypothetical protein
MKPPIQIAPLESPARRQWVLPIDIETMHRFIRYRLSLLGSSMTMILGPPPELKNPTTLPEIFDQLDRMLEQCSLPSPWIMEGSFLQRLLAAVPERIQQDMGVPFLLHFLERATIDLGGKIRINWKALQREGLVLRFLSEIAKRWTQDPPMALWASWCASPTERAQGLLTEYDDVLKALSEIASAGSTIRTFLGRRVGVQGSLSLGDWSLALKRGWQTRCGRFDTPSEWAIFLVSENHGRNTRKIKEALAEQHLERDIAAAWSRYGEWLADHGHAVKDLEVLLGGILLNRTFDVANTPKLRHGNGGQKS